MKKKLKKTWHDVTLGMFKEMQMYMECRDEYTMLNLLSVVYPDTDFEELTLPEFADYRNTLDFLSDEIPRNKVKKRYTLNGHDYNADFDLTKVSIAQFIDYRNYSKMDKINYEDLLSVFFVPKGRKYNDGYDLQAVKEDILSMAMPDIFGAVFFFAVQSKELQIILTSYLKKDIVNMRKDLKGEDLKALDEIIEMLPLIE